MSVSVIIKALNEERHIAAAIESALAALRRAGSGVRGDVILADSGSTDRTLDIAARYPIRIARLADPAERSCGIGPQLGFQYATGSFVCLMDGDMVLSPDFIALGRAFLDERPRVAGVGGGIRDVNLDSIEFERRQKRAPRDLATGEVDRLNGGGLYRRAAIDDVGYFSDRNLHGYEEFDVAVRLRAAGWTLYRLPVPFVDHYGHTMGGYRLLWRRYRTRYLYGIGELLRSAIGRPHFRQALRDLPEIRLWLAVQAGWIVGGVALLVAPPAVGVLVLGALALLPVLALSLRYRSLRLGAYAALAWHAHALGMGLGLLRSRTDPGRWIASDLVDGRPGHDATLRSHPAAAPSPASASSGEPRYV